MPIQGYIQAPFSSSLGAVPITQASWLDGTHASTHASGIDSASIDFGIPVGTKVLSMAPGIIIGVYATADENNFDPDAAEAAGNDMGPRGFGNVVTVFHYIDREDSELPYYFVATYAHLDAASVSSISTDFANLEDGEQLFVEAGTDLGNVGTSGYSYGSVGHLHVNFGVTSTSDNLLASGYPLDEDSPYPNANANLLNFLGFDAAHYVDGSGSISPLPLADLQGDIPAFSYITSYNTDTGETPEVGTGGSVGGSGGVDGPDLTGIDLDIDGTSFDVGETFDFVLDISNIGDLNSGTFSVSFYITEDQTLENAVFLFSEDDLFSLSPSETDWWDYYAYTNGTWYSGNYYLAAVIDSNDDVDEANEENNIIYEQFYLNGIEPPTATDVKATIVSAPSSTVELGSTFTTVFGYENSGNTFIDEVGYLAYVLDSDGSTVETRNHGTRFNFDPGETSERSVNIQVDSTYTPGNYTLVFEIDDENELSESNENNNVATFDFEVIAVTPPTPVFDLSINGGATSIETFVQGQSGKTLMVPYNHGPEDFSGSYTYDLFLSLDQNFSTNDVLLTSIEFSDVSISASDSPTTSLVGYHIPVDTPIGSYHLGVRLVDVESGDTNLSNNIGWITNNTQNNMFEVIEGLSLANSLIDTSNDNLNWTMIASPLGSTVVGNAQGTEIRGLSGHDVLHGKAGNDILFGEGGNDTLRGGSGTDKLFGDLGGDKLFGGGGRDKLSGGVGRDKLFGNSGNDNLFGNGGRDRLDGGAGNDKLSGGLGSDRFIFRSGNDVITDFSTTDNREQINLRNVNSIIGFTDLINNHLTEESGNVVIHDAIGNTLTLLDVNITDLDRGDFIF